MSGVRNVAGCDRCRFPHREGSKPEMDVSIVAHRTPDQNLLTLIALCRALAISLSDSSRGLLPSISGSQN